MSDKLQGSSMHKRDTTQVPAGALLSNCQRKQASKQAADDAVTDAVPKLLLTLTAHRTRQHKDSYHHQGQHVTALIPDAGGFRGPFYLVAAGDWFGSQHLGPHSPREAPHVCTV